MTSYAKLLLEFPTVLDCDAVSQNGLFLPLSHQSSKKGTQTTWEPPTFSQCVLCCKGQFHFISKSFRTFSFNSGLCSFQGISQTFQHTGIHSECIHKIEAQEREEEVRAGGEADKDVPEVLMVVGLSGDCLRSRGECTCISGVWGIYHVVHIPWWLHSADLQPPR